MLRYLVGLAALAVLATAHEIRVINSCSYTVWVGTQGNSGMTPPNNGGFELGAGQTVSMTVGNAWGGRVWGRTNCDSSGHCETGDCGNVIQCNGAGGNPPVTLAEITFDANGLDFYDVSLVDGYNLALRFYPIDGTFVNNDPSNPYSCTSAGCDADLNASCPSELQQIGSNGQVVACKSACEEFNTDQYCCRGAYGTPDTCNPDTWSTNYAAIFKSACPDSYSYAYDDKASTFTCAGSSDGVTGYIVDFCV